MKKILLFFCLSCICLAAYSQNDKLEIGLQVSNPVRDTQVGWFDIDSESIDGFDVRDRSIAVGLLATYSYKDATLRLRLGWTRINIYEGLEDPVVTNDFAHDRWATGKQNKWHIVPGISWEIIQKSNLSVYTGMELPFTLHRRFYLHDKSLFWDIDNNLQEGSSDYTYVLHPGFTIGLSALAGFRFQLFPRISLSTEFAPGLFVSRRGGKKQFINHLSGETFDESSDKLNNITFYEQRFSFGISYRLKNKK
jgi:hypothetical protein